MKKTFIYAVFLGTVTAPAGFALEAVAQSEVGSGSSVGASIGAVEVQVRALQNHLTAANIINQQQNDRINYLEKVLRDITVGPGRPGEPGTPSVGVNSSSPSLPVYIKPASGSWCGMRYFLLALTASAATSWQRNIYYDVPSFRKLSLHSADFYVLDSTNKPWFYSEPQFAANVPCEGKDITVDHLITPDRRSIVFKVNCPAGYTGVIVTDVPDATSGPSGRYPQKTTCIKN